MTAPVIGGPQYLSEGDVDRGVYAKYIGVLPFYSPRNDAESVGHQARMYVALEDQSAFAEFKKNVPTRAHKLLDVLCPASGAGGLGFFDFLVTSVQEAYEEKVQVTEVLRDGHVAFFFGQRAVRMQFNAVVYNTVQDPWYDAFYVLYQDVLRGSRLAQLRRPLRIVVNGRELVGSLTRMTAALDGNTEISMQITFTILLRKITLLRTPRANNPTAGLNPAVLGVLANSPTQIRSTFGNDTFLFSDADAVTQQNTDALTRLVRPGALLNQIYGEDAVEHILNRPTTVNPNNIFLNNTHSVPRP